MNNERKISPKEFSDKRKSQDDEILRKQLELREREIALKEKELELRMLQAQGGENSVEQQRLMLEREAFTLNKKYTKGFLIGFGIIVAGLAFIFIILPLFAFIFVYIFK